jgi:type IV pilus assembly protein PilN
MIRAFQLSELFSDATPESIIADDGSSKLLSSFKMKVKIKGLVSQNKRRSK